MTPVKIFYTSEWLADLKVWQIDVSVADATGARIFLRRPGASKSTALRKVRTWLNKNGFSGRLSLDKRTTTPVTEAIA